MAADGTRGWIALNRFGLGARDAADIRTAGEDPRGLLRAELGEPGIADLVRPDLLAAPAALKSLFADQDSKRLARDAADRAKLAASADGGPRMVSVPEDAAAPSMAAPTAGTTPPPAPEVQIFRNEAMARIVRAAEVRTGFVERLVGFWSNHFCVSVAKGAFVRTVAGAFEREAIRPHVLGRFADMLRAVEQHPAMVFYLDNQQSAGADSPAARRGRGLNENLGREILELHTLGVNGGYTQTDVVALANMISGWTFAGRDSKVGDPGASLFVPNYHQPGPRSLLGKLYPQDGRAQGEAALEALARHPATANHLATKLARHFVSDDPPPALVTQLAAAFTRTDGDLRAMATALIEADAAWNMTQPKLRDPWQFLIAAARLLGRTPTEPGPTLSALALLGQPLWSPPGPNGFADTAATWATPEGLKLRLDIADRLAARVTDGPTPVDLLAILAGDAARDDTRRTLSRAASRRQGLALLLMSPEMQRR